ncbi:receptor-like protein EIX2 [Camellia sinensis]|uniref:receptor-like protein EIX2 n=1 Tax=Camellia sinensis TaxID=4442 RepID=UPI001036E02B|nr:receptor-like protein EIX2 [Camellia sinensis]
MKPDLRNPIPFDSYKGNFIQHSANFDKNRLRGEISPSLLVLNHLSYIDLSMNNFLDMQFPEFLGSLKSLRYLDISWSQFFSSRMQHLNLSNNALVGPIPDTLGRLISLTVLDLSFNDFDNSMLYCLSNLSSLVHMDISSNNFNSLILDALGRSTTLTFLDLSDNNFHNSMLLYSLCNLTSLVHLDLGFNSLNGSIPYCFGKLHSISVLKLDYNSFQGPIPSEIGNMTQLTELHFTRNKFKGEIPNSMWWNLCNLCVLDLSCNKLSGHLPNHLGEFKNLEYLDISNNSFYGLLPSSIGRLSYLRVLNTRNNQLNGSIPNSLGQLSKLEKLDLSNNSFVGMVFELHFAKLKRLNELNLSLNSLLVLNVSSQCIPPFQLSSILMASINVGPQFPLWLKTKKNVRDLVMSNASISDTIPYWFHNIFSGVRHLDLSNNQISGKVPIFQECKYCDYIENQRKLILSSNKFNGPITSRPSDAMILDLSHNFILGPIHMSDDNKKLGFKILALSNNHFTSGIPMSLCKATNITMIDFSKNQLSGRIPQCLGHLDNLAVLDLSNNNLCGHIPSSVGSLRFLISLHLHKNRFHGKLPLSLQDLTFLYALDLGGNAFIDIIPPWIGYKLTHLSFLNLQSNNFYGDIPSQLCRLQNLQLLNLAQNNITGNIPHFRNFIAMAALDPKYMFDPRKHKSINKHYQENMLDSMKGRELEYTKTLKFLISIDLSNNGNVGEIPEELMDLFGLLNLNLSGNHLKGRIPNNIGNLTHLESLDLSRNKLFGPIPPSLSSLSYLNHLNMSFNNLSGRIPMGNQLQTLDDPSIYIGNNGLCGAPLNSCLNDKSSDGDHKHVDESKAADETDFLWFYTGIGPGFSVGFLGVCGTLNFKKSWRYAYFQFIENNYNWISISIAIKFAQPRRKFNKDKFGG